MHRSTFLPLQHTATLIFSVDWGLHAGVHCSDNGVVHRGRHVLRRAVGDGERSIGPSGQNRRPGGVVGAAICREPAAVLSGSTSGDTTGGFRHLVAPPGTRHRRLLSSDGTDTVGKPTGHTRVRFGLADCMEALRALGGSDASHSFHADRGILADMAGPVWEHIQTLAHRRFRLDPSVRPIRTGG